MTMDYLEFDGDSHESSEHWFGMTRSDGAPNSTLSVCFVKPIAKLEFEELSDEWHTLPMRYASNCIR